MSNFKHILLVLGAALVIGSILYLITHLYDRAVFTVFLPGIVVGLILVVVSTPVFHWMPATGGEAVPGIWAAVDSQGEDFCATLIEELN